jgi:hypothetical protein
VKERKSCSPTGNSRTRFFSPVVICTSGFRFGCEQNCSSQRTKFKIASSGVQIDARRFHSMHSHDEHRLVVSKRPMMDPFTFLPFLSLTNLIFLHCTSTLFHLLLKNSSQTTSRVKCGKKFEYNVRIMMQKLRLMCFSHFFFHTPTKIYEFFNKIFGSFHNKMFDLCLAIFPNSPRHFTFSNQVKEKHCSHRTFIMLRVYENTI